MTGFRFASPWWLLLAVAWAAIVWWQRRRRAKVAVLFSSVGLLRDLPATWALRLRWLPPALFDLGLMLTIAALARPQHGKEEYRIRSEGIAIQLCIDRSGSMRAMDFEIAGQRMDRLEIVKRAVRDFVLGSGPLKGRPDDQIGLVAFGGYAECVCPLTLDHQTLCTLLNSVKLPKVVRDRRGRVINEQLYREESATAIGDALVLACDRLKDSTSKSRIIILLSDGESNAGATTPAEAAEIAQKLGFKVYTIGVGTTGGVPMPVEDAMGRIVQSRMIVRLDEASLRAIADATGGKYWAAADTQKLAEVYAEIDRLEKSIQEGRTYTNYRELYLWFLTPALSCIGVSLLLQLTRFRRL